MRLQNCGHKRLAWCRTSAKTPTWMFSMPSGLSASLTRPTRALTMHAAASAPDALIEAATTSTGNPSLFKISVIASLEAAILRRSLTWRRGGAIKIALPFDPAFERRQSLT